MSQEYTSRQERRQQQTKRKSHKQSKSKKLWKRILLGLGAAFLLMIIGLSIAVFVVIHNAPTLDASDLQTPQSTLIYDQDGNVVSTVFHEENRVEVKMDDVPEMMKKAITSIEDKRFYDHHGIDPRRIFGAILSNIKNGWGTEGGSTITQQVIKRSVLSPEKTLTRKVQEAWLSLKLERKYSKDEILGMYLNNVYYGHGAYGIQTASTTYFDEDDLSELNLSQIALLAGMPNSPSADDPFKHPDRAKDRRNQVLSAMANNDVISEKQAKEAKDMPIEDILQEGEKQQEDSDPYNAYIDTVYEELVNQEEVVSDEEFFQGGLKIHTHLDADAQKKVDELLRSEDIPYPDDNFEAGLSLVDTQTGVVKAVGGGRHFESLRYTNHGSKVTRQPGSTIKPVLDYAPAIEHLNWPTSHTLADEEYQYSDGTPINEWDNQYWGNISMRRALAWSRNIPALKAFQSVGSDKAQEFAAGLGINIDPINEAASIGGFDGVSPLQMASAYATFGNGGTYNEPTTVKKVSFPDGKEWEPEPKSETAMQDYTAYMITDMLKSVVSSGTGTRANISGLPVAGKTGSTNIPQEIVDQYGIGDGLTNSWFTGYTTQYSLAVWTGYPSLKDEDDNIQYIREDGSQNIAQQLFQQLMSEISDPNTADFEKPDSVAYSGSELYVRGTQPAPPPPESNPDPSNQEEDQETEDNQEQEEDDQAEQEEENKDEEENKEEQEDQDQSEEEQNNDEEQSGKEDNKQDQQEEGNSDSSESEDQDQKEQKPDEGNGDEGNGNENNEGKDNENNNDSGDGKEQENQNNGDNGDDGNNNEGQDDG